MSSVRRRPRSPRLSKRGKGASAESPEQVFKIGEAAQIVGVAAFVLRFWETQFPVLRPRHAPSKHRFYRDKDIETLKAIKRLLHKERFTIEGARKYIKENGLEAIVKGTAPGVKKAPEAAAARATGDGNQAELLRRTLKDVRRDLVTLRERLDDLYRLG